MDATAAVDAVFRVDLSSAGLVAGDWEVSFAALSEGASTVEVSFSLDGVTYGTPVAEVLGMAEEVVTVVLGGVSLSEAFIKVSFDAGDASRIDNLAIKAELIPEPGTVLLLGAGLAGLSLYGRRRS